MITAVAKWVGSAVYVTLRAGQMAVSITGTLLQIDDSGLLLDMAKGQTFVPMTAVLHITPVK